VWKPIAELGKPLIVMSEDEHLTIAELINKHVGDKASVLAVEARYNIIQNQRMLGTSTLRER
jgi:hypothetical protein